LVKYGSSPDDQRPHRLIVAVANNVSGNGLLSELRENSDRLNFEFAGTLGDILRTRDLSGGGLADEMPDKFAFLNILPGHDFPTLNGIFHHACGSGYLSGEANLAIESDSRIEYSLGIGPNYELNSKGSFHHSYKDMLRASKSITGGWGVTVAVLDSGVEKSGVATSFFDAAEGRQTETDQLGHGTAMTTIVRDIAPNASVVAIRMAELNATVSDSMFAMAAAVFSFNAAILNLSFGFRAGKSCPHCGQIANHSDVYKRFISSLWNSAAQPILVAATGNDGSAQGFDAPAHWWEHTVAVGSINSQMARSSFSNYGTKHDAYIMMPGGDERSDHYEWVGQATERCFGTSVSAAYASGMLALFAAERRFKGLDRDSFLEKVLRRCMTLPDHERLQHGFGMLRFDL
jgi:hypothetical protein